MDAVAVVEVAGTEVDESSCVISRDELLAGRVLSMRRQALPNAITGLRTESNSMVSPVLKPSSPPLGDRAPSPPPGLERMQPVRNLEADPTTEKHCVAEKVDKQADKESLPSKPDDQYKVLVQNLPAAMLKESMLRAMLDQAHIKDVSGVTFQPNGHALITFSTCSSMCRCINHLHGRQWGCSTMPVRALVHTMKNLAAPAANTAIWKIPTPVRHNFSADAPAFVPGAAWASKSSSIDVACDHERHLSAASTDAASDGHSSEAEVEAICT
jgi:hypothetical protein